MVGTIAPIVDGGRTRRGRRRTPVLIFTAASAAAGAAAGAALGLLGGLLLGKAGAAFSAVGAGTVAAAAAAADTGVVRIPFPNTWRQVPWRWAKVHPPRRAAAMYGTGLGIGFATHVELVAFFAVPVWALLNGEAVAGAAVYGTFGLARGLAVAAVDVRGAGGDDVDATLRDLAVYERMARFTGGLVAAAVAAAVLGRVWV